VTDSKEGNNIKFKTTHKEEGKQQSCKNCKSNMMINYTIQMPAENALTIDNSFGSVVIPNYNGKISLTNKFGSLTTGRLSKMENLHVEFGSANIESINNAEAIFKFSTVKIQNISGNIKLAIEFCDGSIINLSNELTSLNLKESYSTVNLKPANNLSASYNISTNFGTFKNKTNADIKRTDTPDKYGPDADKEFEGKSGTGAAKIEVKSSFGTIILGEATEEEMKTKNKEKKKNLS